MFSLGYVTKAAFDGMREHLEHCNWTFFELRERNTTLENEVRERDLRISSHDEVISSMDRELHDLRERNAQLAGDADLLRIQGDVAEERHRAEVKEAMERAKIVGAIWLRESTIRRHPDTASSFEWFDTDDDDGSSDDSFDNGSDGGIHA